MEIARINASVVKVVQLQEDATGKLTPVVLYKKADKKKKIAGPLRPLEKGIRRMARAQVAFADKYLERHERSNQKNRNGFVRDIIGNVVDAEKAGRKKLGIKRITMM